MAKYRVAMKGGGSFYVEAANAADARRKAIRKALGEHRREGALTSTQQATVKAIKAGTVTRHKELE